MYQQGSVIQPCDGMLQLLQHVVGKGLGHSLITWEIGAGQILACLGMQSIIFIWCVTLARRLLDPLIPVPPHKSL